MWLERLLLVSAAPLFTHSAAAAWPVLSESGTSRLCSPDQYAGRLYLTLKLELTPSRQSVSFDDQAEFRILFVGIGRPRNILQSPSLFRDLFLNVRDENGDQVQGQSLPGRAYHDYRAPISADNLEYETIGHGDILGTQFSIPVQEIVPGPGTYHVEAMYQSIVPRELSGDSDVIVRQDGPCLSEPVELVVTP